MSKAAKWLIATWVVIGLAAAVVGGFYWGMAYQKSHGQANVTNNGGVIQNQPGTSDNNIKPGNVAGSPGLPNNSGGTQPSGVVSPTIASPTVK